MDIFEKLGIKIPDAVLVRGITETEKDEEIIDFFRQYGSISRAVVMNEPAEHGGLNVTAPFSPQR